MSQNQQATINIPLAGLKCLYSDEKTDTVVFEMPLKVLKRLNKAKTIEQAIMEAEIDYATGNYKSFKSTRALMNYLNS